MPDRDPTLSTDPATAYWPPATSYITRSTIRLPSTFAEAARRERRIVLEEHQILALDGFARKCPLERQRFHRIEVVAHDPCIGDVRRRGKHVGREHRDLARRFDHHDLMMPRVAARSAKLTPGMISASSSTRSSTPASASGTKFSGR